MATHKLGLVFNLTGSLLLALYIVGKERLKSWEERIKNLHGIISEKMLSFIFCTVSRIIIGWNIACRRKATEKAILEIKNHTDRNDLEEESREWSTKIVSPALQRFARSFHIGAILSVGLWILFLPLMLPLFLTTRFVSWIQKKFRIKSFFGIIGIAFLIVGFILQIVAR